MANDIKNVFVGDSNEEVKQDFYLYMGDEDKWFVDFLYSLKNDWINKGFPVSDILIRENKPIMVAQIKSYVMFSSEVISRDFVPTSSSIKSIVRKFSVTDNDTKGRRLEDLHEFSIVVEGLGILRVSYSSDENGVGMSIRYLTFNLPDIETMQYPEFYLKYIKNLVAKKTVKTPVGDFQDGIVKKGGLIIHVGSTGSGKSTSIAAEVGYLAEEISGSIVTYENPIEYRYTATKAPVRQYELGEDIKADDERSVFDNTRRHILRNNPSVVVFGEARTNDEIKAVIDTAARGVLVFATIHASNTMEALTTLMAVTKDEPRLLQSTLQAVVAHKLIINKEGKIVPIYETLIPNEILKNHIGKQDLKAIASLYVLDNHANDKGIGETFARAFTNAQKNGQLHPSDVSRLQNSTYEPFSSDENDKK